MYDTVNQTLAVLEKEDEYVQHVDYEIEKAENRRENILITVVTIATLCAIAIPAFI